MSFGVTKAVCARCGQDFKTNADCTSCVLGVAYGTISVLRAQIAECEKERDTLRALIVDYLGKCSPPASWAEFDAAEEALRKAVAPKPTKEPA